MRVHKIYWRGVNCWVDCDGHDEFQNDKRPDEIEPNSRDEDARLNREPVNPVATPISH